MGGLFGGNQETTNTQKTINTSTTTVPVNVTENVTQGISPAAEGALLAESAGTSFISSIGQTVGTTGQAAVSSLSNTDPAALTVGLLLIVLVTVYLMMKG
jgi:hypothetical protein